MRLSVLDQSPVPEGSTGSQALHNTIDLAQWVESLGYHRYWVAEHHGGPMLAGPSPEALIGPIASATSVIRVGSGGVMLPHYSPFKVAETFSVLAGLYPGRIDLADVGRFVTRVRSAVPSVPCRSADDTVPTDCCERAKSFLTGPAAPELASIPANSTANLR